MPTASGGGWADRLEKHRIEPAATPGLQGEWHNHCATGASVT